MLIRLFHHKNLRYPAVNKKTAPTLPDDVLAQAAQKDVMVITFRSFSVFTIHKPIWKLTAIDRFFWAKSRQLIFYGLETDSPLAPLILWDSAHVAEVGSTITLQGDMQSRSFFERPYFSQAFRLIEKSNGKKVFEKHSKLPAELDLGLDAWTFGIPVGPEDATLLNTTVERILALDVPTKEILLCGQPGKNFKYLDQVRIVGEDITAPPVQICAKKNRLAEEAKHPNLCIIHDRVFLPKHFYQVVKRFGDFYPLTTMQSVFFDDKFNLIPRRYSDIGVSYRAKDSLGKALMRDNNPSGVSPFAPTVLPQLETSGFFFGNALRCDMGAYPTGSMYMCKRSVWLSYPQNENLFWIEFEDLEQGYRALEGGVPMRVNPHALTQTLISRPLLGRVTGTYISSVAGVARLTRTWFEFLPIPRKPAIKATYDTALAAMQRFVDKYVSVVDPLIIPPSAVLLSQKRLESIINILTRVRVPRHEKELREFISDFEKWIVFDQLPFSFIEQTCHRILVERVTPLQALLIDNEVLLNHIALRPKRGTFCKSLSDYLQKPSFLLFFGTFLSALYLYLRRKRMVYLKGGWDVYFRALIKSTPFKS